MIQHLLSGTVSQGPLMKGARSSLCLRQCNYKEQVLFPQTEEKTRTSEIFAGLLISLKQIILDLTF